MTTTAKAYVQLVDMLKIFDSDIIGLNAIKSDIVPSYINYQILSKRHEQSLPLSAYGDGMKKAVLLLSALIKAQNGILLIDEFEGELRNETLDKFNIRSQYFDEYETMTGTKNYLNAMCNYPLLSGMKANLYKCFLPQAWMLNTKDGVSAFVHPEGVYDDPKGGILRREIYARLRTERTKNKKEQRSKELERVFNEYFDWINNSMLIEDKPYIQIAAVVTGGN